jgi:hypothetical protein
MKIIIPKKEYATFIECDIYEKDLFGESKFLYREMFPKEIINTEKFMKLHRYEKTVEYLTNKLEILTLINADKEIIDMVETIIDKLTRDEVI